MVSKNISIALTLHQVKKILLTNDLTEPVLNEAVEEKVDLVISYHPPLFRPFKRLTKGNWKERVRENTP